MFRRNDDIDFLSFWKFFWILDTKGQEGGDADKSKVHKTVAIKYLLYYWRGWSRKGCQHGYRFMTFHLFGLVLLQVIYLLDYSLNDAVLLNNGILHFRFLELQQTSDLL